MIDRAGRLQAMLDEAVAADRTLPGVLMGVSAPRLGLAWQGAAGGAAMDRTEKLRPDAPFRIASVTKVYVAAALLRLAEDGGFDLHRGIASMIAPETRALLERGGHDPDAITPARLMAHTSGLPDHAMTEAYQAAVLSDPGRRWTRRDQIAWAMDGGGPCGPPGAVCRYSDTGYVILGEILERAAGREMAAAIRSLLGFERLGLRDTYFESLEPHGRPRARQYLGEADVNLIDPSCDLWGGGGLVSTTADLIGFFEALFQGRVFARPETLAAGLLVPAAAREPGARVHALLLAAQQAGGRLGWWHGGFWGVAVFYHPDAGVCLAISVNQGRPARPDAMQTLLDRATELLTGG